MPIEYDAPDNHIGEISIFGPGIGECIVLHIGQGRWFVIDSCLCPKTKQPIALQYLKDIGVDASTQVVGILISHWHSDHIQGASLLRLVAVSPSDVAVTQSIAKLAELKPKQGDSRLRNVVPESANLNAIALHFSFGNFSALLGSDLEETGNSQTGWSAIFSDNIINELSLPSASLFKVSHHGSDTGHHDRIWTELLVKNPLSLTTPFTRCNLPIADNIMRLQKLSSEFLITRDPRSNKRVKRDSMVERELRAIVKERKTINDKMGHIQIRISEKGLLDIRTNENVVRFPGPVE